MQKIITCPTCSSRNVLPIIDNYNMRAARDVCISSIIKFAITNYGTRASLMVVKKIGSKTPIVGLIIWMSCRILESIFSLLLYAINKRQAERCTVQQIIDKYKCRKCETVFCTAEVDR